VFKSEIGNNLFLFLLKFVKTFSGFDFEEKVITLCGIISNEDVHKCNKNNTSLDKHVLKTSQNKSLLVGPKEIESFRITEPKQDFVFKNVNVLDPITVNNNIGRSASKISMMRFKNALERVNN